MKLGIISDTHDNIEPTRKAIEFFEDQGVDKVIHCGDMVAPFTAELFDRDSFDVYAVRGNNDGEWNLARIVREFGTWLGEVGSLELSGKRIGVYHGTEEPLADSMVRSGKYDYVLRGHTHRKKVDQVNQTVEINPGGIKLPEQDERFHIAILDLKKDELKFHKVKDIE